MPLGVLSQNTGLREKLRLATVGGFEGIDIDIEEAASLAEKHSPAYIKGMMDSFNLKAGAWVLPFSLDADKKGYGEGIKQLERYARTAKAINALRVLAVIRAADKAKAGFYSERLRPVAKLLGAYGCTIGVDAAGGPAEVKDAGVVLNARHWHLSGGNVQELKKIVKDRVVYVRLGDVNADKTGKLLPGETGVVDLAAFLSVLADAGYDGPVAPELPDRNLLALPEEFAVRLLGGSTMQVWNKVFLKEKQG